MKANPTIHANVLPSEAQRTELTRNNRPRKRRKLKPKKPKSQLPPWQKASSAPNPSETGRTSNKSFDDKYLDLMQIHPECGEPVRSKYNVLRLSSPGRPKPCSVFRLQAEFRPWISIRLRSPARKRLHSFHLTLHGSQADPRSQSHDRRPYTRTSSSG